jgi:hypothetical protein
VGSDDEEKLLRALPNGSPDMSGAFLPRLTQVIFYLWVTLEWGKNLLVANNKHWELIWSKLGELEANLRS